MKTVHQLLAELTRPDATEFAVATDRLPCIKVGERYEPIDDVARSTDDILAMLALVGGSRHVETLDARPAQWTTRIEGLGIVSVHAVRRGDRVQGRITLARRISFPSAVALRRSRPPLRRASSRPPPRPTFEAEALPEPPRERTALDIASQPKERTALDIASQPRERTDIASQPRERTAIDIASQPRERAAIDIASPDSTDSLEDILAIAKRALASDLHLVGGRPLLLRVGGELVPAGAPLDPAFVDAVAGGLVPEGLWSQLTEHGSCDFAIERLSHGRFRANVSRQRTGLKACLRCIPEGTPTLHSLGLPPEIERATHHHQGLVLVTGPTGHGKTTTLAALVDILNRETTHHVITVEDPIEYVHPRKRALVSQREIGTHTRAFASALKASLREDPDVIVVGELRDTETVRMALAASETGHLVLGTMNTPSVAKTIDRVVDLFPPGDQPQVRMTLAGGLHLVVGQRLLPAANGRGMVAAVELLPGSVALWNLIRDAKTYQIPSLQQRGKGFGILRLDESLADLVRSGRVRPETALAVAEHPEELEAVLSGRPSKDGQGAGPEPARKAESPSLFGKAGHLFGKRGGG